jgi:hypothetical protein
VGRSLVVGLLVCAVAVPLQAQQRLPWFVGLGLGPVRQDRQGNELLRLDGNVYQLHGGWQWSRHLGARVDLMRVSIDHNDDIVFAPCPEPPASCPTYFLGPVRVTGLSTGVETSWIDRRLLVLASVAPSLYWLTDRPPDTRRMSVGVRLGLGGGYQLARRLWAVLDIQYHRLFTDGNSPRWLVPGSIGLEVR